MRVKEGRENPAACPTGRIFAKLAPLGAPSWSATPVALQLRCNPVTEGGDEDVRAFR